MTSPPQSSDGSAHDALRSGEVLDRKYRIVEALGAGGMGVVYLVEHIELSQRMAIKMMRSEAANDSRAVARFVREARAAAGLESEHVVRIFDVGTAESGIPYMVMELLRGQDLSHVLHEAGRLPVMQAVDYVLQACHAISEAHTLGIVHRDLKPSNLFLTHRSDGTPLIKVLDFGISKAMAESSRQDVASLTATSAIMGSPLYMSPEQVRNSRQVDARTDIWSLGVMLYEFLSGTPAFLADTVPGICAAIAADEPAPLGSVREDMPAELEAVVVRCLEKDAARRFQSIPELMNALRMHAPVASRSGATVSLAQTMPETGVSSHLFGSPATAGRTPVKSRGGRLVIAQAGDVGPVGSARRLPDSHGGAVVSGGAVAVSTQSNAPHATPRTADRRMIMIGAVALVGIAGAWALGSMRHEQASASPSVPSALTTAAVTPPVVPDRDSFVLVIDSQPQGASVFEGAQKLGTTPVRISFENGVARKAARRFSVEAPGFLPYSIVQGPSQEDVHVTAILQAHPVEPKPGAAPASGFVHPSKPNKPTTASVLPSAPPAASSSPAPVEAPDIRLQR
jgi:serine/threonine-protein kinase